VVFQISFTNSSVFEFNLDFIDFVCEKKQTFDFRNSGNLYDEQWIFFTFPGCDFAQFYERETVHQLVDRCFCLHHSVGRFPALFPKKIEEKGNRPAKIFPYLKVNLEEV